MTRLAREKEICARCRDFTLKDCQQQAEYGLGRCLGEWEPGINPFVRWDASCVLFGPTDDMEPREAWIKRQQERQAAKESK